MSNTAFIHISNAVQAALPFFGSRQVFAGARRTEPTRASFPQLKNAKLGNVVPPLRNSTTGNVEQTGQCLSGPSKVDGVICFHDLKFTALNTMDESPLNELAGLIPDMALKDRIQELIDAGHRPVDLAKAAGKSRAAVSHWLSGETRVIKADSAAGLQALTGYSSIWISTGKGAKKVTNDSESGPTIKGEVPLLSTIQAGMYSDVIDNLIFADGDYEKIPTTVPVNQYTFAVRVTGDSMEPEFTEGMLLIVEPELSPQPGDYVIARNGGDETTFKQLMQDGADWYLKPLNSRYPLKPLGESTIIGVVRAVEKRYR